MHSLQTKASWCIWVTLVKERLKKTYNTKNALFHSNFGLTQIGYSKTQPRTWQWQTFNHRLCWFDSGWCPPASARMKSSFYGRVTNFHNKLEFLFLASLFSLVYHLWVRQEPTQNTFHVLHSMVGSWPTNNRIGLPGANALVYYQNS